MVHPLIHDEGVQRLAGLALYLVHARSLLLCAFIGCVRVGFGPFKDAPIPSRKGR